MKYTHEAGDDVAHGQPDDDRAHAHIGILASVQDDDDDQNQPGQPQVLQAAERAVRLGAEATAHRHRADLDQGETDERDHDAGNQRRDDLLRVAQETAHDHLDG
jgi:hypothetical protein